MDVKAQAQQGGSHIDVREKVKQIMAGVLRISASEISSEKLVRDDLGMDSMQAIESLAILEKELGIIIDPEKAFDVATVGDLFKLVEDSLSATSSVEVR
ncbi:MAG TPA: acyl carrier protein [Nitrospirota bacterium]|nr:acyl carrier protein [Nitrospirota bacterium]